MNLTCAIAARLGRSDELVIAIDMADADRARDLRAELRRRCVTATVVCYGYPANENTDASPATCQLAGQLRARLFAALAADAVLICSLFETGTAFSTELDWHALGSVPMAVVGYDLIPLIFPVRYLLANNFNSNRYRSHLNDLPEFGLILACSAATRRDLLAQMVLSPDKVTVIGAGIDDNLIGPCDDADMSRRLGELGIDSPFVLMVSAGDWRKNTLGALRAFADLPAPLRDTHQLVLTQIGADVHEALATQFANLRDRVRVLGRVDDATLALLYRMCRVLYFPSYYEGFGLPVLEAMALGAPVLASNAGSLPEVVHDERVLFDPTSPGEGSELLRRVLTDPQFREAICERAREHALTFTWQKTAQLALESLCALAQRQPAAQHAPPPPVWPASEADIILMADACVVAGESGLRMLENGLRAIERACKRRVLVDITEIVRLDVRTGIQRVTRQFFAGLFAVAQQSGHFEVEPFCWTEQGIHYARSYAREHLNVPCEGEDTPVRVEPSDLVFMLDSSWWQPERFDALHARVHEAGGEVVWMVHDLGPVCYPETCNPAVLPVFSDWLTHAACTADGFICNSASTRADLEVFLDGMGDLVIRRPWSRTVHLGSDLDPAARAAPTERGTALRAQLGEKPYFVALGTLEPRKGYATVLAAFEALWARDVDIALVIIGGQGWNVEALAERILQHPERDHRLFWLQGLGDGDVRHLLGGSAALVQASIWEGFGLPLVEARSLGVPLIVSDIAVFHEIAGDAAAYFPPREPDDLAELLINAAAKTRPRARPQDLPARSWREASAELADLLVINRRSDVPAAMAGEEKSAAVRRRCVTHRKRILVDITQVATLDARTGIQRVTRNFFSGLASIAQREGTFKVEPICWTDGGIRYARRYASNRLGITCNGTDSLVGVQPSDLVFMLDSTWFPPERFDALHARVRKAGGEVVRMVYDLIPVRLPQTCDPGMPSAFAGWLRHAVETSDGLVCISDATRHDLESFMDTILIPGVPRPWTRTVHLGSDLDPVAPMPSTERGTALREQLGTRPYFVALGTLEPRKDYTTVLAAFESLWAREMDVALVIIGKRGWNVDALAERILQHPEHDRRLFWLQDAGDGDVRYLLKGSAALIQASIWEGFGLPLVEAGSLGVPLIASDISVFHEVAGDAAAYFPAGDTTALADRVCASLNSGNSVRRTATIRARTWGEASAELAATLMQAPVTTGEQQHGFPAGVSKGIR